MAVAADTRSQPTATTGSTTVASLARDWAARTPNAVAMRSKDLGIWTEYTWADTWQVVHDAAHGLLALGLEPGDRVSVHAEDRPEWLILDLATVAVRGVTVGLYPTNPTAEVEYTLNDCGARIHLAEDQEQVDKVLDLPADRYPSVQSIIYLEDRGVRSYDDVRLLAWSAFLEMGRRHREEHPDAVERRMAEARPDDVMTLVYTSGTTGPPKGAMITNHNAEFGMDVIIATPERMPGGKLPGPKDSVLTYLPLCHIAERLFSTWHLVSRGVVLNFAESIDTVNVNLREVQPTLFFAVPRIWEKLHASIHIKGSDASRLKRFFFDRSMGLAHYVGRKRVEHGGGWTAGARIAYAIGWLLVFRAMRERIGLRRCRWAGSGAAPIAPEVLEFFMGIGINVYELYGMTENTAIATSNMHNRLKLGTVGEPWPQIREDGFRIDEATGEIQTKHDGVFAGYWNKPDKTRETFTDDGWLKTGDVGEWVDGTHVRIVDRIKHIIITSGGKNISPSEIENVLKASPYIKEAMVIGDGRKYLTALIGIELDTVGNWALRNNLAYTTYRDLTEKPEVVALVQKEVDKANERFARVESIKAFRLLPKELDHEDGELTATQKLKRSSMEKTYSDLVESMYR